MPKTKPNPTLGTVQRLTASFLFGSIGMWTILMGNEFGIFWQAWLRALIVITALTIIGFATKQFKAPTKTDLKWFLLLGLAGLNIIPHFLGFQALGASLGTVVLLLIISGSGYLIGKFAFGEKITTIKIISLVIAAIGLLVIYGFSFDENTLFGLGMMTLAAAMLTIISIFPKKLVGGYSQTQIIGTFFIVPLIIAPPIAIATGEQFPQFAPNIHWLALIMSALISIIGMYLSVTSLKHLSATVFSLLILSEIIFGIFFGVTFLGEQLTATATFGVALIILGLSLKPISLFLKRKRN